LRVKGLEMRGEIREKYKQTPFTFKAMIEIATPPSAGEGWLKDGSQ
jgi:hypothetical protein